MSDRAMEALIEAAAGHGMHRPTAEQLRFVHILHHGRAPSLATFRQRLARFRAPPPRAAGPSASGSRPRPAPPCRSRRL